MDDTQEMPKAAPNLLPGWTGAKLSLDDVRRLAAVAPEGSMRPSRHVSEDTGPSFGVVHSEHPLTLLASTGSAEGQYAEENRSRALLYAASPDLAALAVRTAEALIGIEMFWGRPGESANDMYERVAAAFYRETGYLCPGKLYPAGTTPPFDRQEKWDAWTESRFEAARLLLAELGVAQ